MAVGSGDPPCLSELLEPGVFVFGETEDGAESGTLGPLGAVAVAHRSGAFIFSDAALVSGSLEASRIRDLDTAVV